MINDTLFHRFGRCAIKEMSMDKFWAGVSPKSHLYVRTQTERDYFLGMQILEGKPFLVFMEEEERDHMGETGKGFIWFHRYYTNDPVNKP